MSTKTSQELIDYLITLISPPDEKAIYAENLDSLGKPLQEIPSESLCGLIIKINPTPEQAKEFDRILKPGAHLLVISDEETDPYGINAACVVEDGGFEIRDTILVATEIEGIHYIPKASRNEREAGCSKLPIKTPGEATCRQDGQDGLNCPAAGAGRTAEDGIHNFHPCVKSMGIMEKTLQNIPLPATVVDPFLGSGSTGIACLRTGHSFIGIEREEEYLRIADARIRHWNNASSGWLSADIQSELSVEEDKDDSPVNLLDFLG